MGLSGRFPVLNLIAVLLLAGILLIALKKPFASQFSKYALVLILTVAAFAELSLAGGAKQWIYANVYGSKK